MATGKNQKGVEKSSNTTYLGKTDCEYMRWTEMTLFPVKWRASGSAITHLIACTLFINKTLSYMGFVSCKTYIKLRHVSVKRTNT